MHATRSPRHFGARDAALWRVLARFDIDVPAIRVWGDEYRRIGRFEGEYHTLAGTVRVMRTMYRKRGRNGDTLAPVRAGYSLASRK